MDNIPDILPFKDRVYEDIPIEKIKVINSRDRDQEQFAKNVQSIDQVGQQKPIRVNDKFLQRSGMYELICGEGRLLAQLQLGKTTVTAEVVSCTRNEAYLESLVENLARTSPRTMEFARELKRLYDENHDFQWIAEVACESEGYVKDYIRLVEQGEERLIHGVEQGVFPMSFAILVASSDDAQLQNVLMDAFDEGIVTTRNFAQARKIMTARSKEQKQRGAGRQSYTVHQLKQDISEVTKAKTSYVREAQTKENRFVTLLNAVNTLWRDEELLNVLATAGLSDRPPLAGDFHYES